MKKKILNILFAFMLVVPFAFALVGCSPENDPATHICTTSKEWTSDETHHWHKCNNETCDEVFDKAEHSFINSVEDGINVETCTVCQKRIEGDAVKTTKEKIEILINALDKKNYQGTTEVMIDERTNAPLFVMVDEYETVSKTYYGISEDTALRYLSEGTYNPDTKESTEVISFATYYEKKEDKFLKSTISTGSNSDDLEVGTKEYVGLDYPKYDITAIIQNYYYDQFKDIEDEESLREYLVKTYDEYLTLMGQYFAMLCGDIVTYDKENITLDFTIDENDGVYSFKGEASIDEITHASDEAFMLLDSLKVEYGFVYSDNLVHEVSSNVIILIDDTPTNSQDALKEAYTSNTMKASKNLHNQYFEVFKKMTEESPINVVNHKESVSLYILGESYTSTSIDYNETINTAVDQFLQEESMFSQFIEGKVESYKLYLDKDYTIEYDPSANQIVGCFTGTAIYVKLEMKENYSIVRIIKQAEPIEPDFWSVNIKEPDKLEIVERNEIYEFDFEGKNPLGGTDKVLYDDQILINGEEFEGTSITPTEAEYTIELYYYY